MPYSKDATHSPVGAQPRGVAQGPPQGIALSAAVAPKPTADKRGADALPSKGTDASSRGVGTPKHRDVRC